MNTLQQAGDFAGIPSGANEVARFGGSLVITLQGVAALIDVEHPENRPQSLAAVIDALQNLPTITLDAELLSGTQGDEPYDLEIRLNPGVAIPWHTTVSLSLGEKPFSSAEISDAGGDVHPTQLGPGTWDLTVERAGIGSTGMTVLTKSLGQVVVLAEPMPTAGPSIPLPPVPPLIEVRSNGDGTFVVSGKLFVGGAVVAIRVVRSDHPLDPGASAVLKSTALPSGELADFPTGNLCAQLPPGDSLSFSANDGRLDQFSHDLTSNTVTISCPA